MPLSDEESEQLRRDAADVGVDLTERQIEAIGLYVDLLLRWRDHARLVSRRQTRADILRRHIPDSLAVIPVLRDRTRIGDIGAGAGFPGIPIAIVRSDAQVTLIEPNQRKANFLREVIRKLGISRAQVSEARAEDFVPAQPFEAAVSRAVWSVRELVAKATPQLAATGIVVAMKGPSFKSDKSENSATDLVEFGFNVRNTVHYQLAGGRERVLLVLERFT